MLKKISCIMLVLVFCIIYPSSILAKDLEDYEDPKEITLYFNYNWASDENWGESIGEQWITENKKISIDYIPSQGAAQQKLQTMMVADQYPDVIWMDRGADVEKLAKAGKLVPLDPWTEGSVLQEWAGETTLNMLRSGDGKLYQFPNWYIKEGGNGNPGWVINKKIYQELGSPQLETLDDLYNYLVLVKENYPDIVPFETFDEFIGPYYIYTAMGGKRLKVYMEKYHAYPVGTEFRSIFEDPKFKEAILYINKLFRERLMTQDGFTQTRDQVEQKFNMAKIAVAAYGDVISIPADAMTDYLNAEGHPGYEVIWPIRQVGVERTDVYTNGYNALGWNVLVITKDAENPERIFNYFDWFTSPEGQRIAKFGPPGVYYDEIDEDGFPVEISRQYYIDDSEPGYRIGVNNIAGNTTYFDKLKQKAMLKLPEEERDWRMMAQYEVTFRTGINATEFSNIIPLPGTEEGDIYMRVHDIFQELYARMVFAKNEEEALKQFDLAKKLIDKAGFDKVLKYYTEKWHENIEIMGQSYFSDELNN